MGLIRFGPAADSSVRCLLLTVVLSMVFCGPPLRAQDLSSPAQDLWQSPETAGMQQAARSHLRMRTETRTEKASENTVSLVKIDEHLYQTEHALLIIDTGRIDWPEYKSVYSFDNLNYYIDTFFQALLW